MAGWLAGWLAGACWWTPMSASCETWILASRRGRETCLIDEKNREYFPHLVVVCSAETGRMLGMGSTPELSATEIRRVLDEVMESPAEGDPRRPQELWVLGTTGALCCLVPDITEMLRPLDITVRRKASTREVRTHAASQPAFFTRHPSAGRRHARASIYPTRQTTRHEQNLPCVRESY